MVVLALHCLFLLLHGAQLVGPIYDLISKDEAILLGQRSMEGRQLSLPLGVIRKFPQKKMGGWTLPTSAETRLFVGSCTY